MVFFSILSQLITLFIIIFLGYFLRKKNVLDEKITSGFGKIVTNIALPSTVFLAIQREYSYELLIEIGQCVLFFTCIQMIGLIIGIVAVRIMKVDKLQRGVWYHASTFCNSSFMGYPVLAAVLGKDALFYAAFFTMGHSMLNFSLGISFLRSGNDSDNVPLSQKLKMAFINPAFLSGIVGFIFFLLPVSVPAPILKSIEYFSATTTPISMLVVGSLLTQNKISEVFSDGKQYIVSLIRLLIVPILSYFIFKNLIHNELLLGSLIIISAMPVAASAAILAQNYGGNAVFASRLVFVTTLISIATIPIVSYIVM